MNYPEAPVYHGIDKGTQKVTAQGPSLVPKRVPGSHGVPSGSHARAGPDSFSSNLQ